MSIPWHIQSIERVTFMTDMNPANTALHAVLFLYYWNLAMKKGKEEPAQTALGDGSKSQYLFEIIKGKLLRVSYDFDGITGDYQLRVLLNDEEIFLMRLHALALIDVVAEQIPLNGLGFDGKVGYLYQCNERAAVNFMIENV